MSVLKINQGNFESIKQSARPVLLDFYADWCGPCRMLSPIVDEIADEREDIVVGKINVDEEEDLAREFGVFSIPTLVVMKNGRVVKKSAGVRPKAQVLAMLEGSGAQSLFIQNTNTLAARGGDQPLCDEVFEHTSYDLTGRSHVFGDLLVC